MIFPNWRWKLQSLALSEWLRKLAKALSSPYSRINSRSSSCLDRFMLRRCDNSILQFITSSNSLYPQHHSRKLRPSSRTSSSGHLLRKAQFLNIDVQPKHNAGVVQPKGSFYMHLSAFLPIFQSNPPSGAQRRNYAKCCSNPFTSKCYHKKHC